MHTWWWRSMRGIGFGINLAGCLHNSWKLFISLVIQPKPLACFLCFFNYSDTYLNAAENIWRFKKTTSSYYKPDFKLNIKQHPNMASHNRSISQTFNKENRLKEANQAWHFIQEVYLRLQFTMVILRNKQIKKHSQQPSNGMETTYYLITRMVGRIISHIIHVTRKT